MLLAAALAAALTLACAAGPASAETAIGFEGATTLSFNARAVTLETALPSIICEMTMVNTITRGIPKSAGTVLGVVRDLRASNCRVGGSGVRALRSLRFLGLPTEGGHRAELWVITYRAFEGTLPRPTSYHVRIAHVQLLFELETILGTVNCLYEGNVDGSLRVEGGGALEKLETIAESNRIEVHAGGLTSSACPERLTFIASGANGALAPQQTTRPVLLERTRAKSGLIAEENPLVLRPGVRSKTDRLINNNLFFSITVESAMGEVKYAAILEEACRGAVLAPREGCLVTIERNEVNTRERGTVLIRSSWGGGFFSGELNIAVEGL